MAKLSRRRFMQVSAALGGLSLVGCRNKAAAIVSNGPVVMGTGPVPDGSMSFSLTSATDVSAAPFCIGFAFEMGDIATGQGVVADLPGVEVTPMNRYPDGSLRFALVAGHADLSANTSRVVHLSAGAASPSGTALTLDDLKSTGLSIEIACGSFGTVAWTSSDWATPFSTWCTGAVMSSWIFRSPVGKDPHLVAWLEVRLFAGGAVEVLPWIENGYISVPNPTSKSATYKLTMGGAVRFEASIDLPARARTPLLAGTALSHWLASDPGVVALHDAEYLQRTELVPSYRATVAPDATLVTQLAATYAPLQQGDFAYSQDVMSSTGYASPIGPLPQHDVLYLVSNALTIGPAVQRNGYSAGRYGIHYRDEATNKPLRFSQHATTSTNYSSTNDVPAVAKGTAAPQWDVAHSPSVGYMAYLLTGRSYFVEEVQLAATANYLFSTDGVRNGADGWFEPVPGGVQVRQCAWAFRTLVQALAVTPDRDTDMQGEFRASVEANIARFHSRYVETSNNPFGFIEPDLDYSTEYGATSAAAATGFMAAGWMQDFFTGVYGWALAMNLPIGASAQTQLAAFFQWKALSIVGRFGPNAMNGNYWYINAAPYNIAIAPSHTPDFATGAGPWLTSWQQSYELTQAVAATGQLDMFTTTDGVLEDAGGAESMWGNLQPALAYAVRHNVPGAADAYARMTSATNWPDLATQLDAVPVWSVAPRS